MKLTASSMVRNVPDCGPVRRAADALARDLRAACLPGGADGADVVLQSAALPEEQYELRAEGGALVLRAGDALGFAYGLYRVSRDILGVQPLWFWNDQRLPRAEGFAVPEGYFVRSKPCRVRYRGWFINDEVLLDAWRPGGSAERPWEMAFEALLRLGGNLVIPGTDKNAHRYARLASDYGLYVTHHHAEPLGARMFLRAFPGVEPSYAAHPELFERLWDEAIEAQRGMRVVWNVGFRGQGDRPFWADDPRYATPEARGALISRLIRRQVDKVRAAYPGAPCCTNLYGEVMELYRQGHIDLPDDVIRIWADNGYGRMVTRRRDGHDPRVSALPEPGEPGRHGLYYHVSFYDLQAASHMTMLPNPPEFVRAELTRALSQGADAYWIVNCSNVKPHVFSLEYVAALWRDGDAEPEAFMRDYAARYYGEANAALVCSCLRAYYEAAVHYGPHEDQRAGEQFAHHGARMLVCAFLRDKHAAAEDMRWAFDAPSLMEQVARYRAICERARGNYAALAERCERAALDMEGGARTLFEDSLLLQAKLLCRSYAGACLACRSLERAAAGDWLEAFYLAGESREQYLLADGAMREREHGHWSGFYANDCLADAKQSAYVMATFMGYARAMGDGPHYYRWQRTFTEPPEDAQVMLILRTRSHLDDVALFEHMKARRDERALWTDG